MGTQNPNWWTLIISPESKRFKTSKPSLDFCLRPLTTCRPVHTKLSSYFLPMQMRYKFWCHRAVFTANVSLELKHKSQGCFRFRSEYFAGVKHKSTDANSSLQICVVKIPITAFVGSMKRAEEFTIHTFVTCIYASRTHHHSNSCRAWPSSVCADNDLSTY